MKRVLVGAFVAICVLGVAWSIVLAIASRDQIQTQAERAAKLDDYCSVERSKIEFNLRHSFRGHLYDPQFVAYSYDALEGSQWREVAPCVPGLVELRGFCSPGNAPCIAWSMLNATRWMSVR